MNAIRGAGTCRPFRPPMAWSWLLALLVALLAACGGGGRGADPQAPPPAPAISTQPVDQSVTAGASASFSVAVAGTTSPAFQWQLLQGGTWVDIAGATAASYTVSGATLAQHGNQYRVVVSSSGGSTISVPVTLSVTPAPQAPAISVQPAARSVTEPAAATFDVTAGGTAPLTYQWQRFGAGGWTDIGGANGPSYQLAPTSRAADDGARLRVVVGNAVGSVTSDEATLTVDPAPVAPGFTSQPQDLAVTEPAAATFTAAATGTPAPQLQWQRSTDGGASWTDLAGANAASYTTPATSLAMNGWRYRVRAGSSAGTAVSSPALLTVEAAAAAPAFVRQPAAVSVASGNGASFSVEVAGTPTPTLQWQRQPAAGGGFANVTGATGSTYTTPPVLFLDDGGLTDQGAQYRVVATNGQGSVTSLAATLGVTPTALTGFTQLSAGSSHVLGLANDGSVWAWGSNGYGQLGRGGCTDACTPRPVAGLSGRFSAVVARADTSFAIRDDGTLWSWGFNGDGQLGRNVAAGTASATPGPVLAAASGLPLAGVVGVAMTEGSAAGGTASGLAWTAAGAAWKWGNATIEPAMGGFSNTLLLAAVPHVHFDGSTSARSIRRAVAGGLGTVMVVDFDDRPLFWSYNLGGSSFGTSALTPFSSLGFSGSAIDMAIGGTRVLLVRSDGTLWGQAYGFDLAGKVNWNSLNQPLVALALPEAVQQVAVGASGSVSAAVGRSGSVYMAGDNAGGQLGSGSMGASRTGFAAALTVGDASQAAVGALTPLVLRAGGAPWGWGDNSYYTAGTSDGAGRAAGSATWQAREATPHPVTGR